MFESVKQGVYKNKTSYFVSFLFSVITHAVILGVMVSLPLIFYSPLNAYGPAAWFIESPSLSKKVPPPPPPSSSTAAAEERAGEVEVIYRRPSIPPEKIPDGILPEIDPPAPAGIDRLAAGGGIGIGIQELERGASVEDLLNEPLPDLEPPPPPNKPKPVPIVSELQQSKLIYKVDPVYPQIAVPARASGRVVLSAIIDEEGNVTKLKVLSGHPLLKKAAVDAVSQWKYMPTILNGEPVSVSALVTVVFRLR